ncbi:MAG: hypothetical protein EOP88_16820 [Verrucomicrobiaceae bacterium]|nr:MAG: hypothetical protein EOP88_16820 [Verrucomicrobiaceae bacterium]
MAKTQKSNRKKSTKPWFFKRKGFWFGLLFLGAVSAISGYVVVESYTRDYRQRAETYDLDRINDIEVPSIILDRNDKEIGRIFLQNRSVVSIDKVPKVFIDALVAGEDSRFWSHNGVDYIGTARALMLTFQGSSQGGSTITQQLARNAYNLKDEAKKRNETTIQRKLVEAFLAMRIEKKYKKTQILDFYLNRIFFGKEYYGIRSASLGYYGKEPADLTTEECASIVALIKSPNPLSPLNDPVANKRWRNFVLGRMREEGTISRSEMQRCQALPLKLNPKPLRRGTSHLYERITDEVRRVLGEDALAAGGFKVHTTILAEAQNAAQESLLKSLAGAEARPGYGHQKYKDYSKGSSKPAEYLQGAVLMIDHDTGEVLAHVGGRDYAQVPYDFIELGKRPLGTAFFPFIYAAGLSSGMTPATPVEDEPMDNRSVMVGGSEGILGEWGMEVSSPVYERKPIPARMALEQSKIAATVRFAGMTGLQRVVDTAVDFGLPLQKAELLPRLAVGFEEVSMKNAVRAMSAFPRGGMSGPENLFYVDRVQNAANQVVYRRQRYAPPSSSIIDSATAWQVHSMMAGSLFRGSSKGVLDELVETPFHGSGKGGTTHDFSDTWFLGYNKRITCGVWTGFLMGNGQSIYPGAFSRDLAMPVWAATMNAAAPSFGGGALQAPDNVTLVQVCSISGQKATQFCQEHIEDPASGTIRSRSAAVQEYFRRGTENLPFCNIHSGVGEAVSADMNLLNLPALDAVPVRPKEPVLIGDDPYHTEIPSFAATSAESGLIRRRTNVLDSLDLGDIEDKIPLQRPRRLQIEDE